MEVQTMIMKAQCTMNEVDTQISEDINFPLMVSRSLANKSKAV
jgi:hypothetical protein